MYVVSEHNTLYVEVHCPTVQPDVVVISNSGQTVTDFGQVSVGQRVIKSVIVQNISDNAVDVSLLVMCLLVMKEYPRSCTYCFGVQRSKVKSQGQ